MPHHRPPSCPPTGTRRAPAAPRARPWIVAGLWSLAWAAAATAHPVPIPVPASAPEEAVIRPQQPPVNAVIVALAPHDDFTPPQPAPPAAACASAQAPLPPACTGLRQAPDDSGIPSPVDNPWALGLLVLVMGWMGWMSRQQHRENEPT